ncbi:MAG: hypothetical protein KatS3mg095_0267 [Candidatus Parcubacteria bacterium]|nr:MAG: hypothetical protein KatS3mg095_0267 [Candidatus Parcubacteria bacterium]
MRKKAFTLIEVLLVIGIIVLLAGAIVVAINPARQFQKTRNTQRTTDVSQIRSAIVQVQIDNQGRWICPSSANYQTSLPTNTTFIIATGTEAAGQINLSCLVPNYLPRLPRDPLQDSNATDTRYTVRINENEGGRLEVCAPDTEPQGSSQICSK